MTLSLTYVKYVTMFEPNIQVLTQNLLFPSMSQCVFSLRLNMDMDTEEVPPCRAKFDEHGWNSSEHKNGLITIHEHGTICVVSEITPVRMVRDKEHNTDRAKLIRVIVRVLP